MSNGGGEPSARAWSARSAVDFYTSHRSTAGELYASEKRFMAEALAEAGSVLDIGCAAGGFSQIVREYRPGARFAGVDVSPAMIAEAHRRFPRDDFRICNGQALDFPDASFDTCISLGVLHMTTEWRKLLAEAWRVCRRHFLFDLRVVEDVGVCDPALSYQRLAFNGLWDRVSTAPYIVVGLAEVTDAIKGLGPSPGGLQAYGYRHQVSDMTVSPYREVCMAVFLLAKEPGRLCWELPLPSPGMTISGGQVQWI